MSSDETSRVIEYPDLDALAPELRVLLGPRAAINVYRMVMHSPGIAGPFLNIADAFLRSNSLPADLRELAILRVGHAYAAPYETFQHERIARVCGLSEPAITAAAGGDAADLGDAERQIIAWTDRLLAEHRLDGDDREAALARLGVQQLADLVLTVGFYQLVCNFLNTFDVTTDGEAPIQLPASLNARSGQP